MKQLYCPHRITISGIQQYCNNGKPSMDCEHCDCPDKKEFDVTITTSSSEILSNKMKREEEIIKASHLYAKHQQKPFIDGARLADKTMIDKACKWLKENGRDYATYDDSKIMPSMRADVNIKRLIKDFRKAMEVNYDV